MLPRDLPSITAWLESLARSGLGELAWILGGPTLRVGPSLLGGPTLRGGSEAAPSDRARSLLTTFSDEFGDRRPVDAPLLASVLGVRLPPALLPPPDADPALRLWHAVAADVPIKLPSGTGPLFPQLADDAIEPRTEAELSGLHALSLAPPTPELAARIHAAARWLMAELQPDNGTNRPWASHVFLRIWSESGDADARLYGETLVHNCRVSAGVPDRLSAVILASSVRALREQALR